MTKATLMPCPVCGDTTEAQVERTDGDDYAVRCGQCSAWGPWHRSPEGAVAEWNRNRSVHILAAEPEPRGRQLPKHASGGCLDPAPGWLVGGGVPQKRCWAPTGDGTRCQRTEGHAGECDERGGR
jgi:hypothetical protein